MAWNDVKGNGTSGSEEKVNFTKIEAGQTAQLRVLDAEPYSRWTHWLPKHNRGISCIGKGCPICEIIKQQKANKLTPTYSSAKRHAIHVWNYGTNRVEIFEQGNTVFETLLTLHETVGELTGYDIKVVRKGKDRDTVYTVIPCASTPISAEVLNAYTEDKVEFKEYFTQPTPEQVQGIVEGKSFDEVFKQEEVSQEEEVSFVTE